MERHLVVLDRDHPGFRDEAYRGRRNDIARAALAHRAGEAPPRIAYTPEEDGVWQTALAHLLPLHRDRATRAYRAAWPGLAIDPSRIAQLAEVNQVLASTTGFRMEPVAGLVDPRTFLETLAGGVFLATQYIRHASRPLYTPESDVIHEVIGHGPLLSNPAIAGVHRAFGDAAKRASPAEVEALIRVYWFTLEFGLAREAGEERVVGAGLLSSYGELERLAEVPRRPFSIAEVAATAFDTSDYQQVYFVADSVESLLDELGAWLSGIG